MSNSPLLNGLTNDDDRQLVQTPAYIYEDTIEELDVILAKRNSKSKYKNRAHIIRVFLDDFVKDPKKYDYLFKKEK